MGKITLITGGSRSGKSTFAENMLKDKDDVLYIATAVITDKEMENRVEKHKVRRNQKWGTYEGFKDLNKVIETCSHKNIMLECIGTMITNMMFEKGYDFDKITSDEIEELTSNIRTELEKLILATKNIDKHLIIVTNEVGWSLVPEYKLGRIFVDILGHINQFIGQLSDEAYLVSCGFPLKLK